MWPMFSCPACLLIPLVTVLLCHLFRPYATLCVLAWCQRIWHQYMMSLAWQQAVKIQWNVSDGLVTDSVFLMSPLRRDDKNSKVCVQQKGNVWEQGQSIQHHEFWRIHQAWPSQRRSWLETRWALFSGHLIRGVGHSNSSRMPSGWLCPALLSFLSIHNGELPSSNPNLFYPNDSFTSPHNSTCSALLPPIPHLVRQWGRSGEDRNTVCTSKSCLHNKVWSKQGHRMLPTTVWPHNGKQVISSRTEEKLQRWRHFILSISRKSISRLVDSVCRSQATKYWHLYVKLPIMPAGFHHNQTLERARSHRNTRGGGLKWPNVKCSDDNSNKCQHAFWSGQVSKHSSSSMLRYLVGQCSMCKQN